MSMIICKILIFLYRFKILQKQVYKILKSNQKFFNDNFNKIEDELYSLIIKMKKFPDLQNKYLSLFKIHSKNLERISYLEDAVLVYYKGYQKFGTHYRRLNNDYMYYFYPFIGIVEFGEITESDIYLINKRRALMNLDTLDSFINNEYINKGVFIKKYIMRNE